MRRESRRQDAEIPHGHTAETLTNTNTHTETEEQQWEREQRDH